MVITGARIALSAMRTAQMNVWIANGRISFSPLPSNRHYTLNLEGFLLLPGLINAHDHLELNLFPKLGAGPYPNASDWARDIYCPNETPIKEHLALPKALRLKWGAIKNLVSGVTTVAHHNAFHQVFLDPSFPLRVVERYGWAHSLAFSPDWKRRFENTPADYPFIIHAAEGVDKAAYSEIRTLANAGLMNRSTILVHGVGIDASDLAMLKRAGASIVWCPTSNNFILNRTVDPLVLNSPIAIALGSDSAITANGDLLDELHFANRIVDAQRLYSMVTSESANVLKLPAGFGHLRHDGPADLLVLKDKGQSPAETLLNSYPELVMVRGRIQLASHDLVALCPPNALGSLQQLYVTGRGTYMVAAPISAMLHQTKEVLQQPVRLAGKAVAA